MKLKAFFFEILPITIFFILAQYQSIIIAALISFIFSLIVLIIFYVLEKRVAKFQIFSVNLLRPMTIFSSLLVVWRGYVFSGLALRLLEFRKQTLFKILSTSRKSGSQLANISISTENHQTSKSHQFFFWCEEKLMRF